LFLRRFRFSEESEEDKIVDAFATLLLSFSARNADITKALKIIFEPLKLRPLVEQQQQSSSSSSSSSVPLLNARV